MGKNSCQYVQVIFNPKNGCSTVHYSHKAVAFSDIAAFDNIKHCVPTAEDSLLGDKEGK